MALAKFLSSLSGLLFLVSFSFVTTTGQSAAQSLATAACPSGYTKSNANLKGKPLCTDLNECTDRRLANRCKRSKALCRNTLGSFQCVCPKGLIIGVGAGCVRPTIDNSCLVNGQSIAFGESIRDPNSTCNTCTCTKGGLACTKVGCVAGIDAVTGKVPKGNCGRFSNGTFIVNGTTYASADGCNTCTCINGGSECTKVACNVVVRPGPDSNMKGPPGNCGQFPNGTFRLNGTSYLDDQGCNSCFCTNGLNLCTLMACGVLPTGKPQPPGNCGWFTNGAFKLNGTTYPAEDGCNTCVCNDGTTQCTWKDCYLPPRGKSCVASDGTVYEDGTSYPAGDGCNTCMCTNGVGGACTRIKCLVKPSNKAS